MDSLPEFLLVRQSCVLWLVEPFSLRQFMMQASVRIDAEQARAAANVTPQRSGKVGILPVHGVLETRRSAFGEMFGMTSYERIGQQFDALMADDSISGIVLDVASPGGMAYGAPELADKIYSARGRGKSIIAVANPMAASGAYWIAAAADRVVSVTSGDVGSVGVIMQHVDLSSLVEGKVTTIRSSGSPYKAEGDPLEPLTDEAKQHFQSRADEIYDRFVADLARFRNVSAEHVNEHFGKGRVVSAKSAMRAGMIDRVDDMRSVAVKVAQNRYRMGQNSTMDEWNAPTVRERCATRIEALKLIVMSDSQGAQQE